MSELFNIEPSVDPDAALHRARRRLEQLEQWLFEAENGGRDCPATIRNMIDDQAQAIRALESAVIARLKH